MKNRGFKSTGNGPRYGDFGFSSKKGFSDSSGKTRTVGEYSRRTPKRKAVGGLVDDDYRFAPTQGFSEGGKAESKRVEKGSHASPGLSGAIKDFVGTVTKSTKVGKDLSGRGKKIDEASGYARGGLSQAGKVFHRRPMIGK